METRNIDKYELNDFINELFRLQRMGSYVFRGYCNKNELLPLLVRNYDKLNLKGYGMGKYERVLLENYARFSIQYLPAYYTPLDWVASAQHFGLPTRLIDWSLDPFCALYFATAFNRSPEDDCYKLIMVDLNEHIFFKNVPVFSTDTSLISSTNNHLLDNYFLFVNALLSNNGCFSKIYHEKSKVDFCNRMNKHFEEETTKQKQKLFFCSIYDSNPRIIAQKGLFQIPRRFTDSEEKDIIDTDILLSTQKMFLLDKSLRNDILSILEKLNITTPRLFPDLQNICAHLKNAEPWQLENLLTN